MFAQEAEEVLKEKKEILKKMRKTIKTNAIFPEKE